VKVVQIGVKNIEKSTWKIVLQCKIVIFVLFSLSSSFFSVRNYQKIRPNMSVLSPRKWNSLKLNRFQQRPRRKIPIRFFWGWGMHFSCFSSSIYLFPLMKVRSFSKFSPSLIKSSFWCNAQRPDDIKKVSFNCNY